MNDLSYSEAPEGVRSASILLNLDIQEEIDWSPDHLAVSAWLEHVPFAFWITKALRPSSFVELGTHYGVSYAAFCQAVQRLSLGTRCYAIDTWAGDPQAGAYGEEVYTSISALNERRYRAFSTLMRMTFDEARDRFGKGEIDLLHIDGYHTYEAVSGDFRTWRDALSDRAVVLFHDTNVRDGDFGVWRLWRELKAEYPHFEFLHEHGLGVLGLGRALSDPLKALLAATSDTGAAARIRNIFASRGEAVRGRQLYQQTQASLAAATAELDRLRPFEAEAARLRPLEQEIANLRAACAQATEDLAVAERRLGKAAEEVADAEGRVRTAEATAERTGQELRAIQNSRIWRSTRPYRAAMDFLRGSLGRPGLVRSREDHRRCQEWEPSGESRLNPPAARPAVDFDLRRPDPAAIPSDTEQVRLQLRYRGRELGKLDLRRVPGLGWDELIERWIREEGQPRLLPRFLWRNAWRDWRLLAHLARLAVERRTLRYLWAMVPMSPALWPGEIRAYVVARQDALLPAKRAARPRHDAVQAGLRQNVWDRVKWESLFTVPDPWAYSSPYEQRKYEQTLELLPEGPLNRVLELACAEGHFTVQLAPRVGGLLAADIAAPAIERARERCRAFGHVGFQQLDMRRDPIPGRFELIVCSEVLYYIGNRFALARFARKVAAALEPGGHLLTTHAHAVVDDPSATGFDWQVGFAGKHIGEAFARVPGMELVRELRTPVYRVQLFRRSTGPTPRRQLPRELVEQQTADVGGLASGINWGGCAVTRTEAANAWMTRALPILMYHRIAEDGPAELAPYRVAPALFERQLAYLRRHGYRTVTVEEWLQALAERDGRIDDRVVAFTFDDAYRDFITDAWPLLRQYDFSATVYVATDHVGGHAGWDRALDEPAPIMSWHELRALAGEGLAIGAHSGAHPFMTQLAPADMLAEGRRSKERLERELGRPVVTMAYPYGDNDLLVRRTMAACGFAGAVTTAPGLSRLGDNPMAIPRQLVDGTDDLDRFIAKLGRPERATLDRRARYRYVRWAGENLM